jgi:alkaline phosphatase
MTKGALNVLGKNPKGFYVMIEGGAVDWAGHANQPGRIIEEMIGFNAAVQAAQDWVNRNSSWDETLIIITSDHETGLLLGLNSDRMVFDPVINRGAGRMPGMYFNSGGHSNLLVPIRARGPGAELFEKYVKGHDPVHGRYVDNTTIFEVAKTAMGATSPGSYGDNYGNGGYGGPSPYGGGSYPPGGELMYDSEPGSSRNYGSYGNGGGSYGSSNPSTRPSTTYND